MLTHQNIGSGWYPTRISPWGIISVMGAFNDTKQTHNNEEHNSSAGSRNCVYLGYRGKRHHPWHSIAQMGKLYVYCMLIIYIKYYMYTYRKCSWLLIWHIWRPSFALTELCWPIELQRYLAQPCCKSSSKPTYSSWIRHGYIYIYVYI